MGRENSQIPNTVVAMWLAKAHGVVQAFSNTLPAFKLVWKCGSGITLSMTALTLLPALLPAAQAWVAKLIVDGVVAATRQQMPPAQGFALVVPYLGLEFALIFAGTLIGQVRSLVEHVLHARLTNYINDLIINKALALDLRFFEDGQFYDKLQNARRFSRTFPRLKSFTSLTLSCPVKSSSRYLRRRDSGTRQLMTRKNRWE